MSVVGGYPDPPVPPPRSRRSVDYDQLHADKEKLVDLFRNLRSGAVDSDQIDLARTLIERHRGKKWYEFVSLDCILKDNGVRENKDQLLMMESVFDYVIKYAINMIKPQRHVKWRAISTNTPNFITSVDCMKGARGILRQLGYVKEMPNSMEVGTNVAEPDRNKVANVLAELLMCKLEVEKAHRNPQILDYHLKGGWDKDRYREDPDEEFYYDAKSDFDNRHHPGQRNAPDRARAGNQGGGVLHSWKSGEHKPPLRALSGGSYTTTLPLSSGGSSFNEVGRVGQRDMSLDVGQLKEERLREERLRLEQNGRGYSARGDHHLERGVPYSSSGNASPQLVGGIGRQHGVENRALSSSSSTVPTRAEVSSEWRHSGNNSRGGASESTPVTVSRSELYDPSSSTYSSVSVKAGVTDRTDPSGNTGGPVPPIPPRGSSSSSDMEGRPSSSSFSETPGRGTPDRSESPADRPAPVPVPRRGKANTSSRPVSMGTFPRDRSRAVASEDTKTPHRPVRFTSQDDSQTSGQFGNLQSQSNLSGKSSASSSGISTPSSVFSKFAMGLQDLEKKSQAIKNSSMTSDLGSLGGENVSSMASRGSFTMSHTSGGFRQDRISRDDSKPVLSLLESASDNLVKHPPKNRWAYSFKEDCLREEEDLTKSTDSSGSCQRPKPEDGNSSEDQRIFSPHQFEQNYSRIPEEDTDHRSVGSHRYSGDYRPHSGEHRGSTPNSGESHRTSGERRRISGEQRPMSREHTDSFSRDRQSHSGEKNPPRLEESGESSFHNRSSGRLSSNDSAEKTQVTPVPAKRSVRPMTTPVKTDTCCRFCQEIISGDAKYCPNCGERDPLTSPDSSISDLGKTVSPSSHSATPPVRASVKDTKKVEEMHLTRLQEANEEEAGGQAAGSQGGHSNWEGNKNSRGDSRRGEGTFDEGQRKVAGPGQDDFDYNRQEDRFCERGGAVVDGAGHTKRSNSDRDEKLVGGAGRSSGASMVDVKELKSNRKNSLAAIQYTEEEKQKRHEKFLLEKAAKEREKEGGYSTAGGRSEGACAGKTLAIEQKSESNRKDDLEEMGRHKPDHPQQQEMESERKGQYKNNTVSFTDIHLAKIRQDEDEKERCRQEFLRRKKTEQNKQQQQQRQENSIGWHRGGGRDAQALDGNADASTWTEEGTKSTRSESSPSQGRKDRLDDYAARLDREGKQLLRCIKECCHYNYSLGEIHLAYHNAGNQSVLGFLDTVWANKVRNVRQMVGNRHQNGGGRKLGVPTEKEVREMLVKTRGNENEACINIASKREEKILQLLDKMAALRRRDPTLPALQWNVAADALSRNGMEVNKTFYILQMDWLEPLYDFIFGEFGDVKKIDMENIKKMVTNKGDLESYSFKARCRLLMSEFRFPEKKKAEMVLDLIEKVEVNCDPNDFQDNPLHYYVDAANDFSTVDDALKFLRKECPLCFRPFAIHEMITMPGCTDSMCKECFSGYLTVVVKTLEIKHYNCPVCGLPNMADREAANDMYFTILVAMAMEYLDSDVYTMMDRKLTEFNLISMPGFIWCANCPNGFIYDVAGPPVPREITCGSCHKKMCHKCKKPWEAQHEGVSCENFAQWKQDNDPDAQKQGLAAHLNANGIECPACHMRYDLARGGCMHFICTRCPNEFCSGCGLSMKKGNECGKFESCKNKGLHAHHPRDCLFYLRDFDVKELQDFLRANKVEFDVDASIEQVEATKAKMEEQQAGKENKAAKGKEAGAAEIKLHCQVMLQKETPQGLRDEECGTEAPAGHAGLCVTHYKEYLVDKINKKKLDPITMYPIFKIKLMLEREEMKVPKISDENDPGDDEETEEDYNARLIRHVKKVLPLLQQQQEGEAREVPLLVEDIEEAEEEED